MMSHGPLCVPLAWHGALSTPSVIVICVPISFWASHFFKTPLLTWNLASAAGTLVEWVDSRVDEWVGGWTGSTSPTLHSNLVLSE